MGIKWKLLNERGRPPRCSKSIFSPQWVRPAATWPGGRRPPRTARCAQVSQQALSLGTHLRLAGVCVCVCICLVRHLPRRNPMANRSSGGGPNSSNSWRPGARGGRRTGSPARRLQPQLSELRLFPALDASLPCSRDSPMNWKGCGKILGNSATFPTNKQGN